VPKVKDIINAKKKKIYDDLTTILKDEIETKYYSWAKKLLEDNNPTDILAAILNYCFEEELNSEAYGKIKEAGVKGEQLDQQGKTRLFVALGKRDKIDAGKLIELIMSKVSIKSKHIRDIQVMDKFSFITVPFDKAEKIVVSFKEKGQKTLITHAKKKKSIA
jgi:ATP-dependent RNA helicase DeaD